MAHAGLIFEFLAARAVPAGVFAAVNGGAAVGTLRARQPRPQFQQGAFMSFRRGADELVVADPQPLPQPAELRADFIAMLLRSHAALPRDALDVLPVLVVAGEQ